MKIYYQPILPKEDWGVRLHSFEVYYDFMHAKNDFPDCVIAAYSGDDIEDPTYVDIYEGAVEVCSKCGSTDVEIKTWVNCQTGRTSEVSDGEIDDTWCNVCEDHTGIEAIVL